MYESITYAELKKLPSEEKAEAWKELKSLYKTQKELAEKLGVSAAVVYNMISRYAKGEKGAKLELVEAPEKSRARVKKKLRKPETVVAVPEPTFALPETGSAGDEAFSIVLRKLASGEDAQFLLNGIGSTLLKNQMYLIEVKIVEK